MIYRASRLCKRCDVVGPDPVCWFCGKDDCLAPAPLAYSSGHRHDPGVREVNLYDGGGYLSLVGLDETLPW